MDRRRFFGLGMGLLLAVALPGGPAAASSVRVVDGGRDAQLVTLPTRPGATQSFLFLKPDRPVANAILFAGGKGVLNLREEGGRATFSQRNFLVRTRDLFLLRGLAVAVVDAPSDHHGRRGMAGGFRNATEHVTDIEGVIAYVAKDDGLPVWLIGTSRGTESAAFVAIHSRQPIAGVVLTSSITVGNDQGTAVTDLPLDRIKVPVLVVAHRDDRCRVTPPANVKRIAEALGRSSAVEVKLFSGGKSPRSAPCKPFSAHGYYGIEEEVVTAIGDFVAAHSK